MILYKLWSGGLFNQVLSLENAYIIANALQSNVGIHSCVPLDSTWRIKKQRNNLLGKDIPYLKDIIIKPNNIAFLDKCPESNAQQISFFKTCISLDGSSPPTDFLDSRDWCTLNKDLQYQDTLGWKSIVFWSKNHKQIFDCSIQFKHCYTNLADKISKALGDFAAIHVRRQDLRPLVSDQEIKDALPQIENFKTKLLLTDEIESMQWLTDFTLIDDLIYDHAQDYKNLEYSDETIFGLISALVATKAKYFIGTIPSTYSGYIATKTPYAAWFNDNSILDGTYEWNKYPISTDSKLWYKPWTVF
jgi:hypothetical protein